MIDVLKALFSSKKFIAALFGVAAHIALKLGFELDVEEAMAITSPILAYILGQSAVDVKKAAGAGSTAAILVLVVGVLGASGAMLSSGCASWKSSATGAASSFVDCLAPNTKALAGELQGTVADVIRNSTDNTGKVDWTSVKSSVGTFKSDAPLCAFQAAVRGMLLAARAPKDPDAPQSAGLEIDATSLETGYEAVRLELFAGRLGPL